MPEFEMNGAHLPEYRVLDPFTRGYIEAMFFTDTETGTVHEAEDDFSRVWNPELDSSLPGDVGFEDLAPEALEAIKKDCANFQKVADAWLQRAYDAGLKSSAYDETQAGRDFWFTRNGHGVGYWDRDFDAEDGETIGKALSHASKRFGEVWSCFGDDGRVYVS